MTTTKHRACDLGNAAHALNMQAAQMQAKWDDAFWAAQSGIPSCPDALYALEHCKLAAEAAAAAAHVLSRLAHRINYCKACNGVACDGSCVENTGGQ